MPNSSDILVFPAGAPIRLPVDVPELPTNIYSEFGFKLITLKKKDRADVQVWTVATEEDYRNMLARLQNIRPEDVVIQPGAEWGSRCHLWNGVCTGSCASLQFCEGIYDTRLGLGGCKCG
jgi:hypothetical protein